jgi:hypothetical protein
VGNKFRDKHGKIRKWPKKGESSKLEYNIQELVSKMFTAAGVGREAPTAAPLPKNLVRRPHAIAPQFTAALSKQVKKEQLEWVQLQSAPEDGPVGVPLLKKHKRKIFYSTSTTWLKASGESTGFWTCGTRKNHLSGLLVVPLSKKRMLALGKFRLSTW